MHGSVKGVLIRQELFLGQTWCRGGFRVWSPLILECFFLASGFKLTVIAFELMHQSPEVPRVKPCTNSHGCLSQATIAST